MTIKFKNINVNYEDYGQGTPLVLLHGFLETSQMWHELLPQLSQNHRVILIDLLGHGNTDS